MPYYYLINSFLKTKEKEKKGGSTGGMDKQKSKFKESAS